MDMTIPAASSVEQWRAENAADAFWTLDPLIPIGPGDLWFSDLESDFPAHEYDFVAPLVRRLTPPARGARHQHVAVVGHRGVGKSTLVRKAVHALETGHGFLSVYLDVESTLDLSDFTFPDVLISVVSAVAGALEQRQVRLPDDELRQFRTYFADELLTKEHVTTIAGSTEAHADAGASVPLLARLLAKVTALMRSDNVYRQTLRRQVERDPRVMLERANLFLAAASRVLGKHLLVVLDNLEKISDRKLVEKAVLQRASELRSLLLSMVLFLHPADEFAPHQVRASEAFPLVHLPTLPVRKETETYEVVNAPALAAVRNLLDRRVDLSAVFDDVDACVRRIVRHSGGRLRDVLELARGACELVDGGKVSVALIDRVARKTAGYRGAILSAEDNQRLVAVARTKKVPNDASHGYLLLHSMVLQYNGVPWWDIHPLLLLLPAIGPEV